MYKVYLLAISVLVLASCQKEEDKLAARFLTDFVGQVNMGSEGGIDYQNQVYFDLSSGQNKGFNKRDVWDLALGCDAGNPNLFVNPSMLQRIAITASTDINASFEVSDYDFEYERARRFFNNGFMMDDWDDTLPKSHVCIIDLGKIINNQTRGYKLFQVTGFDEQGYHIKVANLDHSQLVETTIPLNRRYNHVYISLAKPNEVLELEPPKEEWDLLFTKYIERLYDGADTLDYSVTGVLINPYKTSAYLHTESYLDSTWSYNQLTVNDINFSSYSKRPDVIGHDWKFYDLDAGAYSVYANKNFFVKDAEEQNYRLHFTGFYDDHGNKGGVSFEYLPL